jgi:elongation factor P--(R)-beta-lysine ligase
MFWNDGEKVTDTILARQGLVKALRDYFAGKGYVEVETPSLMASAPPDPHIDPLKVYAGGRGPFYLHTSPEVGMKKILASGLRRIFQVCKVFREEEFVEVHSTEFTMLEWYMEGTYLEAMDETEALIRFIAERLPTVDGGRFAGPFRRLDLQDLFVATTGLNPFGSSRDQFLAELRRRRFPGVDETDTWNDLFFKVMLQEVEPRLKSPEPVLLYGWPSSISTMAQRKDVHTVERFELYIDGLEIANGYTELLDAEEQRARFAEDNATRKALGKAEFPIDEEFLEALSMLEGPIAGVSIGIDRLLMALGRKATIDEVLPLRLRF